MALVKCRECGNEVSTKATACPKCGAVRPKPTPASVWIVILLLALFFIIPLVNAMIDSVVEGARYAQRVVMVALAPVLPRAAPTPKPVSKPPLINIDAPARAVVPAVAPASPAEWKRVESLRAGDVTLRVGMTHDDLVNTMRESRRTRQVSRELLKENYGWLSVTIYEVDDYRFEVRVMRRFPDAPYVVTNLSTLAEAATMTAKPK